MTELKCGRIMVASFSSVAVPPRLEHDAQDRGPHSRSGTAAKGVLCPTDVTGCTAEALELGPKLWTCSQAATWVSLKGAVHLGLAKDPGGICEVFSLCQAQEERHPEAMHP